MAASFAQTAQGQASIFNPFATQTKPTTNPFGAENTIKPSSGQQHKRKGRLFAPSDDDDRPKHALSSKTKDQSAGNTNKQKGKRGEERSKKGGEVNRKTNGNVAQKQHRPKKPHHGFGTIPNDTSSSSSSSDEEGIATKMPTDPHAKRVFTCLRKENISPPNWPSQPGNPENKVAMARFREQYEQYREKVRAALTKAGLIDDPDQRKTLEDAIDFKGICEDMCPEYEKIQRITENDLKHLEKDPKTNHAVTTRMVKKLARSAAGQEAPLPMDIRSVPTLRKTIDYLIDDLLRNDSNLPGYHGFLWDRTRAIRRDFTFFSSLTPEELKTQVYVLETIARFHVTSLHLCSRKEHTYEGFSEQQELEQLGKSLLSLRDLYDDCNEQGIVCENEAEFRAYFVLHHGFDSNMIETLQRQWEPRFWRDSDEVRTAVSLVEALQNTTDFHGPLKPGPWLAASGAHSSYFRIVEDPSVSYTMACFAECNFPRLRRSMLNAIVRALARPKEGSQDVTAAALTKFLRFDTVEEAIEFAELHELEFQDDPESPLDVGRKRLILQHRAQLAHPRLSHQFSHSLVEKKRGRRSLPEVLRRTVFEVADKESLFVTDAEGESSGTESAPQAKSTFPTNASAPPANPFASHTQISQTDTSSTSLLGTSSTQQASAGFGKFPPSSPFTIEKPAQSSNTAPGEASAGAFPPKGNSSIFDRKESQANISNAFKPNPFASQAQSKEPEAAPASSPFASTQSKEATGGAPRFDFAKQVQSSNASVQHSAASVFGTGESSKSQTASSQPPTFSLSTPNTSMEDIQSRQLAPTIGLSTPDTSLVGIQSHQHAPTLSLPTSNTSLEGIRSHQQTPTLPALGLQPVGTLAPVNQGTPQSLQPAQSLTTSVPSSASARLTTPPTMPQQPPRDLLGDLTKWYVLGDGGILDDFKVFIIDDMLKEVYDKFVEEEHERLRLEQERRDNDQADAFRKYQISVRYFYKWKNNAREKRLRQLRRSGRDQARAFLADQQKRRDEEARRLAETAQQPVEYDRSKEFKAVVKKQKSTRREAEEALLQSGVLSGVENEREAAAKIVRREHGRTASGSVATNISRQSSPGRARRGAKTQAIREALLGPPVGFRRSLPSVSTRSTASPEPSGPRPSRVSERWRLKAMGIVQMPDGTAVPESIARQALHSSTRYPGLKAPGTSYRTSSRRASVTGAAAGDFVPFSQPARPGAVDSQQKRKRTEEDDGDEKVNAHKRVMSDAENLRYELRALRQEMENNTTWFKSQNDRLQSEGVSRGTTPFDRSI